MRNTVLKSTYLIAALGLLGATFGCDDATTQEPKTEPTPVTETKTDNTAYDAAAANQQLGTEAKASEVPAGTISVADRKPKDGEEVAVLDTGKGKIIVMFFPDKAPNHVKNFKKLVKSGFYNSTKFHRTIPGFMIQGGDPNTKGTDRSSWGMGGPDERVKAEFNDIHHARGVLSMARSGDPDSAGSQFFLVVADTAHLNHQYTAFGKVVTGIEVADEIVAAPAEGDLAVDPVAIKKATLAKWPLK